MSRKSKAEYIGEKRRAYACASAAKRRQILDEVCETLCYTRKYVIKLMTGNIRRRSARPRQTQGNKRRHCKPACFHFSVSLFCPVARPFRSAVQPSRTSA